MAQVEATLRVKENIGFVMAEYERRQKANEELLTGQQQQQQRSRRPKLPEIKRLTPTHLHQATILSESLPLPPLPKSDSSTSRQLLMTPELCMGKVLLRNLSSPSSSAAADRSSASLVETTLHGEHVVRCYGCQVKLRVKLFSTLVKCPDCYTISPASSTRP
jgi:hypothetical protein